MIEGSPSAARAFDLVRRVKPGHDGVVNHTSLFTAVEVLGGTYLVTGIA